MTDLLIRLFVKEPGDVKSASGRTRYGNFASVVGILCNVFLCILKGAAGLIFHSVAILADAVNNLSDAGNSIISLIGFALAERPADEEHPYGHARVEYLSCLAVSFVIIGLGVSLFVTSFRKILSPEPVDKSLLAIAVLVISILVKLWMSAFYKSVGSRIQSSVILANSRDSFNDVISTAAVLLTTVIAIVTNINLDGYAGCAVAVFIAFSGFEILKETVSDLLGTMPAPELVSEIVDKLESYEGVHGIHDLVVHSYGADKVFATVHLEVPADGDILELHDMIDNIERDFREEKNIQLVIHMDPVVTNDEEVLEKREMVAEILRTLYPDFTMHDFRMVKGETHSNLIFDVVAPISFKTPEAEIIRSISDAVRGQDEKLFCVIDVDRAYAIRAEAKNAD